MKYLGIAFIIGLFALVIANVRIVPQASQYVIEFLGKFKTVWDAGIHVKIPFFEKISKKVTLKEITLDTPPQPVITKDNVTMQIDTVIYYHVYDAKLFTYGAQYPIAALSNLTATTLRNIVGELELDETLTSRDTINGKMAHLLDEATDKWGIKVSRVELKNIVPPREIQEAMEKQMKAERDKRETLLEAEAHKQAAITRAQGDKEAMILAAEGERDARIARAEGEAKAAILAKEAEAKGLRLLNENAPNSSVLELKRFESMVQVANGQAAKIIVPTDMVSSVKNNVVFSETAGIGDKTDSAKPNPAKPKTDPCCDEADFFAEQQADKKA